MEQEVVRLLRNPIDDTKELSALASRVNLDNTNPPAIVLAARHQNINVMRILLLNGANIDTQDDSKDTALIHASNLGKSDMVKFLLDNEANPNLQNKYGLTALSYSTQIDEIAGRNRFFKTVEILSSNTNLDLADNEGMTALMYACLEGNVREVNVILSNRANPFIRNNYDQTAYDLATNEDIKELIRYYEDSK